MFRCTLCFFGFLVLAAAFNRAGADEPYQRLQNELLTMQARSLIAEDEVLGPLNIGIIVKDRVAVLWGPVPSLALGVQAEMRLRTMIELTTVRNELFVIEDQTLPRPDPFWKPAPPKYLPDVFVPPATEPRPGMREPSHPIIPS